MTKEEQDILFDRYERYYSKIPGIVTLIDSRSIEPYLTDDDMKYIETLIKDTYQNIKALKFNPIKEDKQGVCKNCVYKQLCKLDLI